jgi:hypothetical protein
MSGLPVDFVNSRYARAKGMTLFGVEFIMMNGAELVAAAVYLAERLSVWEGNQSPSLCTPPKMPATSFVITVTGGEQ